MTKMPRILFAGLLSTTMLTTAAFAAVVPAGTQLAEDQTFTYRVLDEHSSVDPQVVEDVAPALTMVAVRPSWVRVRAADGTVIYEATMQPGDTWEAPLTEEAPTLRTGESGAIYFAMNDKFYGPVGPAGSVTSNLPLEIAGLKESYLPVDVATDDGLVRYAEAKAAAVTQEAD